MLKIHVRRGLLGEDGLESFEFPFTPDATPRQIVHRCAENLPRGIALDVARNGRLCSEADYDTKLADGDVLMIVPTQSYGIDIVGLIVYALVTAIVSFAVNYAIQQLSPTPKPPDVPQERGDSLSPVYSWDGITTSYGQGTTVAAAYGRHYVGGQVIYTTVQGTTAYQAPSVDKVALILALSEGPIARIGDIDHDFNQYGGFSGGTSSTSFPGQSGTPNPNVPQFISVNNNALTTTSLLEGLNAFALNSWSNNPELDIGDSLQTSPAGTAPFHYHQIVFIENQQTVYCLPPEVNPGTFVPSVGMVVRAVGINTPVPQPTTTLAGWSLNTPLSNPQPGVIASGRMGRLGQLPLPTQSFPGVATTFTVNASLDNFYDEFVFTYDDSGTDISSFSVVMHAPGGIYGQNNQGAISAINLYFEVRWRYPGQAWQSVYRTLPPNQVLDYFTFAGQGNAQELKTFEASFNASATPVRGPIEVRVRRTSPTYGTSTVTNVIWRNVTFNQDQTLAYPRVALLGLELAAGARFNGGLPQVKVRIDGIKVRVWDPDHGWSSDRFWDAITGDHNDGQWNYDLPGRNPAWILCDFLTQPWGLGRYVTDDDLDMDSIYAWAVWCDQQAASDWDEPKFLCDIVCDTPRPSWEWVLAICAAGRAAPVFRNGKIGVVYEYASAHGNNKITVPAKTPTQLLTSGTVEKVQVTWLPRQNRPTAISFQFLNEATDNAQDVITVEDPESTANDPTELFPNIYRPETLQAYGVTRASQLFREGIYRHRVNSRVRRELTFVTGRWALAAEVGDVIEFEHELLRPWGDVVPTAMHVVTGGDATTTLIVDHLIELPVGETLAVICRDIDGVPNLSEIIDAINTTTSGQDVCVLTLLDPVDAPSGSPCVVGILDQLTEQYQIVAITIQRDLKREVRCLEWVPSVHDEVTLAEYLDGGGSAAESADPASPVSSNSGEFAQQLLDARWMTLRANADGTHTFSFVNNGAYKGSTARIYWRTAGDDQWVLAGSTEQFSVVMPHLDPHAQYEFVVAFESMSGDAPTPDRLWPTKMTAPEFPIAAPSELRNIATRVNDDGVFITWTPSSDVDQPVYEVRAGTRWSGGRVVYRGKEPRAVLWPAPLDASVCVAVMAGSGLYSQPVAVAMPTWPARGDASFIDTTDVPGSPGGTHDGTQYADASLQLDDGEWEGTYTSAELDAGFEAPFVWRVAADIVEESTELCGEVSIACGSGEAAWRTLHDREASAGAPGVDWSRTCDDPDIALEDIPDDWTCAGFVGQIGSHTRALIEARFYSGGAWSAWAEHKDGAVVSSKAQFRVTLSKATFTHEVRVLALRYTAHLI